MHSSNVEYKNTSISVKILKIIDVLMQIIIVVLESIILSCQLNNQNCIDVGGSVLKFMVEYKL